MQPKKQRSKKNLKGCLQKKSKCQNFENTAKSKNSVMGKAALFKGAKGDFLISGGFKF